MVLCWSLVGFISRVLRIVATLASSSYLSKLSRDHAGCRPYQHEVVHIILDPIIQICAPLETTCRTKIFLTVVSSALKSAKGIDVTVLMMIHGVWQKEVTRNDMILLPQ